MERPRAFGPVSCAISIGLQYRMAGLNHLLDGHSLITNCDSQFDDLMALTLNAMNGANVIHHW